MQRLTPDKTRVERKGNEVQHLYVYDLSHFYPVILKV